MRAIILLGLVAAILGGSLLFARQVGLNDATARPVQIEEGVSPRQADIPPALTCCAAEQPEQLRIREIADLDVSTSWLQVGVLMGRVEEAAQRDVAPSVLAERLREADPRLATHSDAAREIVRRLAADVSATQSPEMALTSIRAAIAELRQAQTQRESESVIGPAAAAITWTGTWNTTYGTMVLSATDDGSVSGAYGSAEHVIAGRLSPSRPGVLEGTWQEGSSKGRFQFRLTEAGSWEGHWTSGDLEPGDAVNWVAQRSVDRPGLDRWIGDWTTSYGAMTLSHSEGSRTVEGWYGSPTNRVVGWTNPSQPNVLIGYWYYENTQSSGRIEFRLNDDNAWTGSWSGGLHKPSAGWSGTRAANYAGDLMEDAIDAAMEGIGRSDGAEAGSVARGAYSGILGEE